MFRFNRFSLILGLAGAMAGLPSAIAQTAQNNQDEPGDVAAAIRFQKNEDAAAARQARSDSGKAVAKTDSQGSADRAIDDQAKSATPARKQNDQDEPGDVADAIRFQKNEEAAAARQARIEERGGEQESANAAKPHKSQPHNNVKSTQKPAKQQ